MKIQEATAFIKKNNHPKLWALLAEVALNRLDTVVAEHAFVMLKDYAGIQLIKRIGALQVYHNQFYFTSQSMDSYFTLPEHYYLPF